ncbi:MAG: aminotransferase class V-fold PLP-dependent enzyme [Ruminococcus sp.]|nr:aminotransferase class V-fold PLP-dependent enzyme [Ruminococcus sp.]
MDTPIYDFLKYYADSGTVRCHMPGHKGREFFPDDIAPSLDITEIFGADSLFEADGIIRQSERGMSELYGTADTFYSAGGSTLCIQAMLAAMKQEGRTVVAVRNVHRSFLNSAALLGLDVKWVMPDYTDGILSGTICLDDIEHELAKTPSACVYLTSPDYTGRMADIRAIAEVCHRYGAPLLADNAHGAHLRFMPEDCHPITLGADMCCDSAHKMLPALTGAAMLHTSSEKYAEVLRQCMSLFASTSPSYLILASLDLCRRYISEQIRIDTELNITEINKLRHTFADSIAFADGDPFHITLKAAESGLNGNELAGLLRKGGVECEYADSGLVVLLMSPMSTVGDYVRLTAALDSALSAAGRCEPHSDGLVLPLPVRAMSIRDAVLAPSEEIPVSEAEGRICAAVKVPCPPAVPIAASGETISRECIDIFRRYGIDTVNVVRAAE